MDTKILRGNDNEKKICKIYHIFVKQFEILDYKLLPFFIYCYCCDITLSTNLFCKQSKPD